MVEWGDTEEVIHQPQHPYTQLLISAVPDPSKSIHTQLDGNKGDIPLWTPSSSGCPFAARCPHSTQKCKQQLPEITQLSSNHFVRCHLHQ